MEGIAFLGLSYNHISVSHHIQYVYPMRCENKLGVTRSIALIILFFTRWKE
jgi:hypothetical protein